MHLKDIAKLIYEHGTLSGILPVKITTIDEPYEIVWEGKAIELQYIIRLNKYGRFENIGSLSVCEIKRSKDPIIIPIYNRGIHITVY